MTGARVAISGIALSLTCGLACGLAACGSASSGSSVASTGSATASTGSATGSSATTPVAAPTANQAAGRRLAEAPALLVQCALDRGFIKSSSVPSSLGRGGQITPGIGASMTFNQWYASGINGTAIGGQDLTYWALWAATNDKLPPAVCGTTASAPKQAERLFPGAPVAWGS